MVTSGGWILLSYRVPREPSAPRIAIWRHLKRLGVAQLGDGLVALPADARTKEHLEWVASHVDEAGGTSVLWRAEPLSHRQDQQLVDELSRARAAEYRAIAERAETTTHSEAVQALRSLRRELRQVERRDYFPPTERDHALAAIGELANRATSRHIGQEATTT